MEGHRPEFADSGLLETDIPRERIAVLISQNSGEVASTLRDLVVGLAAPHMIQSVGNIVTLSPIQAHAAEPFVLFEKGDLKFKRRKSLFRLICRNGGVE